MARGKYAAPRKHNPKLIALILALVLLMGSVIGGTVAWLMDETEEVVNTFTYGDIDITLDETDIDENGDPVDKDGDGKPDRKPEGNDYEMIPGEDITKDPMVTVKTGSEEMWLFVKLEESENFDDFIEEYELANGWNALEGEDGVYYRHVTAEEVAEENKVFEVIKDNTLTVKGEVTKEMLNALDKDKDGNELATKKYPTLTVTAYAVQYAGFAPETEEGAEATPAQIAAAAAKAWTEVVEPELSETP